MYVWIIYLLFANDIPSVLQGLTGTEGTFRRTMEVSISLLRDNKDTLMGVLEPFIRDPTVSWGRSGRAQREENTSKGPMKAIQDTDNRDAKEALLKITERLNGIYNLCHPSGKKGVVSVYFILLRRMSSLPLHHLPSCIFAFLVILHFFLFLILSLKLNFPMHLYY